jgi:hypothetical protein
MRCRVRRDLRLTHGNSLRSTSDQPSQPGGLRYATRNSESKQFTNVLYAACERLLDGPYGLLRKGMVKAGSHIDILTMAGSFSPAALAGELGSQEERVP